jgi:uncharacterized membrane protein required for colicin V production
MQLDIILLIIIAIFVIFGFKNGFVYTLFRVLGWLVAIAVAYFTRDQVREFLMDHTPVYDWYHGHIYNILSQFVGRYTGGVSSNLPNALGGALDSFGGKVAEEAANSIASSSFAVLSFIAAVLVVKLILFLFTLLFSRKYHGGFIGGIDALGGIFVGFIQGVFIVFIILLLITPVSFAIGPGAFDAVSKTLDHSFFSNTLYQNNPLSTLSEGFIPGDINPNELMDKWKDQTNTEIEIPDPKDLI